MAEYTVHLFDALRRSAPLDKQRSPSRLLDSIPPISLRAFDACMYQIGNNGLHAKAYRAALETPGIVVLHDAVLHHLLLGMLTEDEYIEEFVFNYGGWYREVAAELWRDAATR